MERLFDLICRAGLVLAGIGLCVIIATFGWHVYGRYILNDTPTWVEQLSLVLIVWISFLVSAVVVREDGHLSVEMFRDALPRRGRLVLRIVADLLLLAFGVLMAWQAGKLAAFGWSNRIPLLGLPEGVKSLALAICGGAISLFVAWRLAGQFRELFTGSRQKVSREMGSE